MGEPSCVSVLENPTVLQELFVREINLFCLRVFAHSNTRVRSAFNPGLTPGASAGTPRGEGVIRISLLTKMAYRNNRLLAQRNLHGGDLCLSL